MPDFPIIDAHVHLWDPELLPLPWLQDHDSLNRAFLPADLDAARGDIDLEGFVYVETGVSVTEHWAEVEWVTELAAADPRLRGIVAAAPLEMGENVCRLLDRYAEVPLVKGIRRNLEGRGDDFCLQPAFIEGIECLAKYNYTFDLCIREDQLQGVIDLVCQCPEVTFVLDHFGKPDIIGGEIEPWEPRLEELSQFENCHCKLSGLATEADHEAWEEHDLKPYVKHAVECFGPNRVFFGGDWPVATLATDYPRWVDTLERLLPDQSTDVLKKVFRKNARKVYRLG